MMLQFFDLHEDHKVVMDVQPNGNKDDGLMHFYLKDDIADTITSCTLSAHEALVLAQFIQTSLNWERPKP